MPQPSSRLVLVGLALLTALHLGAGSARASGFTISTASTTAQSLNANDVSTVTATGTLTVSGSTVAVTVKGSNATLTNLGTISQTGTGRVIRDNTGVSGLMITNGSSTNSTALMKAADADVIQMAVSPASVTLNNYGTLESDNASKGGAQAVDFSNIASGSNVVNNYATGKMTASEADAVRPGVNGVVNNQGTIKSATTTGSSSDGVDAQMNSGIVINNAVDPATGLAATTGPRLIEGGRHGITGGAVVGGDGTFLMTVNNHAGGTIQGDAGSGINIDGFNAKEVVTIVNNGMITGNSVTGDSDGVDVDGLVNLTNTGTIHSLNALNDTSEGVTVGGGTIINSGTIQGSISNPTGNTGTGRGITIAGIDKDPVTEDPIAVQAPYAATTITNSGLIQGDSDSGIAFTSALQGQTGGFNNTITNQATGTIKGGGTTAFAIQGGADNDTVNNAGIIDGSSSGKAIDLGAGNNNLNITGGQILGNISGGVGGTNAMDIALGTSGAFTAAGIISDFNSVEIDSGFVTFSGANTYTGTTTIKGGTLFVADPPGAALGGTSGIEIGGGGTLMLGEAGQINPLASLTLNGGTFDLNGFSVGGGGVNGLSSLFLNATSFIDFGDPISLEFGGLGGYTSGSVLNLLDFELGDHLLFAGNPNDFTSKFNQSDLCAGGICGYTVTDDGSYYEVDPVPEPASLVLMGLGLTGLVVVLRRRQRAGRVSRRLPA